MIRETLTSQAPSSQVRPGQVRPGQVRPGPPAAALGHPLRVALLGLLAARGTVTATQAGRELGESSGACSFHLRQLERFGHVEPVPGRRGRARPWRLAVPPPPSPPSPPGPPPPPQAPPAPHPPQRPVRRP
jgi:hypothetical protein